jgi:hypothetical protein
MMAAERAVNDFYVFEESSAASPCGRVCKVVARSLQRNGCLEISIILCMTFCAHGKFSWEHARVHHPKQFDAGVFYWSLIDPSLFQLLICQWQQGGGGEREPFSW